MRIKKLEVLKKDPEKAFWDTAITQYYHSFRKEMEDNPKKKFYNLWSVQDMIKISSTNPPTPQDLEVQAFALNTHNVFNRLREIRNETLLISASHDRLTPKSCMEEIHEKIPNSTLKIIEKTGHSAPLEKAPEVNKILMEFLKVSKEQLIEATM
jgi:pimeloyl-ACP methyl ester carboxylesterase